MSLSAFRPLVRSRWSLFLVLAVAFVIALGAEPISARADVASGACNYAFSASAGSCDGATNYRATELCKFAFSEQTAGSCGSAADSRSRETCAYVVNQSPGPDCVGAASTRATAVCDYAVSQPEGQNCAAAIEERTEATCDRLFDEPYDDCVADASARTTAALAFAGLGNVATPRVDPSSSLFLVGALPGAASDQAAVTYTTAREMTLTQADGTLTNFATTYEGQLGGPNEQVAQFTVGYITQSNATFRSLDDGVIAVVDSSNNVVDAIAPPTVLINGADTVTTTLVPVGDRLDAVLEQPFTGSGRATVQRSSGSGGGSSGAPNRHEIAYCIRHVSSCYVVNQLADEAMASSMKRFPDKTDQIDGNGDAYRHCWWMALVTVKKNASIAKNFGDRHEQSSRGAAETKAHYREARAMDLYNNAVGRKFGSSSGASSSSTFQSCLRAAKRYELRTIEAGSGRILTRGLYDVSDNLYPND